jgi:hypothetical protein
VTKVDARRNSEVISLRSSGFIGRPPVYFQCTCTCTRSGVYRNHTAPGSAPRARAGGGSTTLRSLRRPASSPPARAARTLSPTRGSARAGLWLPDGTRLRLLRYFILVFVSTHLLACLALNQARPRPGHTETRWTRARDMNTRRKGVHGFTPTPLSRCGSSAASPTPLHA